MLYARSAHTCCSCIKKKPHVLFQLPWRGTEGRKEYMCFCKSLRQLRSPGSDRRWSFSSSDNCPSCKTCKIKHTGHWRLRWSYRNGKSRTYPWTSWKLNKQIFTSATDTVLESGVSKSRDFSLEQIKRRIYIYITIYIYIFFFSNKL